MGIFLIPRHSETGILTSTSAVNTMHDINLERNLYHKGIRSKLSHTIVNFLIIIDPLK
jgi:hypothetical protein